MAFAPVSISKDEMLLTPVEKWTRWRGRRWRALRFLAARAFAGLGAGIGIVHIIIFLIALAAGLVFSAVNPPITSLMIERPFQYHIKVYPVRYLPISRIPLEVQRMLVVVENNTFYTNPGVDIQAIEHAWKVDKRLGYWALGGSTITQQLVRSLLLTTNKSFARKYVEALMSLTLNLVMSKQRQLELYFNYIEWGKGIFGIQAASYAQYGKPLSQLTTDQIIRLLVILPNPWVFNVHNFVHYGELLDRYHLLWSVADAFRAAQ